MDKYIKLLLEQYSKIILPEFGAIVIENAETGNLMFNEYLTYDDEKLAQLIVSESNMNIQEAKNAISKFVRDLIAQLNKGESYSIYKLGKFIKDEDGNYLFLGNIFTGETPPISTSNTNDKAEIDSIDSLVEESSHSDDDFISDSKLSSPSVLPSEEANEIEENENTKEIISSNDRIILPKEEINELDEKTIEKELPEKENSCEVELSTPEKEVIKEMKKEVDREPVSSVPIIDEIHDEFTEEEDKKRKSFLIWLIPLLLLVVLAVYIFFNFNEIKEYIGLYKSENTEQIDSDNSNFIDASSEGDEIENVEGIEGEDETEAINGENNASSPILTTSKGNFNIYAGAFGNKDNAQRLMQKFRNVGFDSYIKEGNNGLHSVIVQSYPTNEEAQNALKKAREIVPNSYIGK